MEDQNKIDEANARFFTFDPATRTITGYNIAGGLDVVVPSTLSGVVVESIGGYTFDSLGLTNLVLPDSLLSIGKYAFRGNNLTVLELPNSLETTSSYAFANNELTSVTFGNNLRNIEFGSFLDNNLTSIIIGDGVFINTAMLSLSNNCFRDAYLEGGAGVYEGTQTGRWTRISD